MASALGMGKKPSPEEIRQRQGQVSKAGKSGDTMKVRAGSATGSGLFAVDPRFDTTGKISVNKAGQKEFWVDANEGYRWDPVRQRYKAIDGYGRGYVYLDPVQQASSGGGGGGGKSTPQANPKIPGTDGQVYFSEPGQGVGTPEIMGDTYNNMMDWRPVSRGMNGGTQSMNPLVDPNAWLHQVNPAHTVPRPVGTYIENDLLQNNKGLLV